MTQPVAKNQFGVALWNSESGRKARLAQAIPPRLSHGLTEIIRGGQRQCRPARCAKGKTCPVALRPASDRPSTCEVLEKHLTRFSTGLKRAAGNSPVAAHLITAILRREALLWAADLWLSEVAVYRLDGEQVVPQPVLTLYSKLLQSQEAALRSLGCTAAARPDPSQAFAAALEALPDCTPPAAPTPTPAASADPRDNPQPEEEALP